VGVSAFDACGLCDQMGPVGLMGLMRRTFTSEAFSPTGWWICTHSVYADTPIRRHANTPLRPYSAQTVSPATIVRTARPFRFQPSKGVLRERDNDSSFL
jgi:hypothetical protein